MKPPLPYLAQRHFLPDDWARRAAPGPDTPSLQDWRRYAAQARREGAAAVLRRVLVQLSFPIQPGIGETDAYRQVTLRGVPPQRFAAAGGLPFIAAGGLEIAIHEDLATAVPVIIAGSRPDFIALVQALSARNEPRPVPDAMGAAYIAGYNNWARLRAYRAAGGGLARTGTPDPIYYRDDLIIASRSPYSGVPAASLGLTDQTWDRLSLEIRLAHECAHAFTRRVCGTMHRHLLDELAADYHALRSVSGRFEAEWLLRFQGLEAYPHYRSGGRLENYLPPNTMRPKRELLQALYRAIRAVAAFDVHRPVGVTSASAQAAALLAIVTSSLEALAVDGAVVKLLNRFRSYQSQLEEVMS